MPNNLKSHKRVRPAPARNRQSNSQLNKQINHQITTQVNHSSIKMIVILILIAALVIWFMSTTSSSPVESSPNLPTKKEGKNGNLQ